MIMFFGNFFNSNVPKNHRLKMCPKFVGSDTSHNTYVVMKDIKKSFNVFIWIWKSIEFHLMH